MARRILLQDARPRMLSCKAGFYRAILLQIRSPLKFFLINRSAVNVPAIKMFILKTVVFTHF